LPSRVAAQKIRAALPVFFIDQLHLNAFFSKGQPNFSAKRREGGMIQAQHFSLSKQISSHFECLVRADFSILQTPIYPACHYYIA
jgi:hypothetical protein